MAVHFTRNLQVGDGRRSASIGRGPVDVKCIDTPFLLKMIMIIIFNRGSLF